MRRYLRRLPLYGEIASPIFVMTHRHKERFTCPVCGYRGPFLDTAPLTGFKRHSECPKCGSLERHRLQYLVMEALARHYDFSVMSMLHFAPEPFFRSYFRRVFKEYVSADLYMKGVDLQADLRSLPVKDASYDVVFASHVLEHIKEDGMAVAEIRRVLRPGGFAVLPVPVVAERTVEYPEANDHEAGHVRAPGADYYERYRGHFQEVEVYSSEQFPDAYQTFSFEDRTGWPTPLMPLRSAMEGEKHPQTVPVCYAGAARGARIRPAGAAAAWFELRRRCPACGSSRRQMVYSCPFLEPPILDFLNSFYGSQGHIEPEYLEGATFRLEECLECGALYQQEIPGESLMKKLYEQWIDPLSVFGSQDSLDRHQRHAEEIMSVIMYFRADPRELALLDVGMGWGKWCRMAQAFGCEPYGVELSQIRARYAKAHGIKVVGWDELPAHRFDFINADQVLEHLPEPLETLRQLAGSLKPQGLIKVAVPNGGRVKRLLKAPDWTAPKGAPSSLNAVSPLEHINCFSRKALIRMAGRAGLVPQRMPLAVQYAATTDWRPGRRMCGNLLRPLRNRLRPGTYVFFRRGEAKRLASCRTYQSAG